MLLRCSVLTPYLAFARAAFQRQLAYRTANWAGLFTNAFFLFFRAYALEACYAEREQIGGLGVVEIVTYATVSQSLLMVCPQWGSLGLGASVRTGQVAMDLLRPVDLVGMYLARRLAISGYFVGMRMLPVMGLGAVAGLLSVPAWPWLLPFAASVLLAASIATLLLLLVELSSFWLESERGIQLLVSGVGLLASGLILPIDYLPGWMQQIARLTPFPYTLYVPTEIWLGRLTGEQLLSTLAIQLGWGIGLFVAARGVLRAGERRLQVLGG